jgi:tetratricopeptide (TPR) repeat protein
MKITLTADMSGYFIFQGCFMNPHVLIIITGIFYILIFGGLSLLRREGLSTQFAVEGVVITLIVLAIAFVTNTPVNPLAFLIFLYLITMRGRLLVDIANLLSSRGRQRDALRLLEFGLRLLPDHTTRMVILVNMGIVQLRRKNPASAQQLFEEVIEEMEQRGGLGIKYEAACRYNLGQAFIQQGKEVDAVRQFNETRIIYPNSIFAKAAANMLEKRRTGRSEKISKLPEENQDPEG